MARAGTFEEPGSLLPLRWWSYGGRSAAGLAAIVAGALLIVSASGETWFLTTVGSFVHVAGWLVLPARGWRRVGVAFPSLVAVWLLLLGSQLAWLEAVVLALWFLVRQRPGISYVALALPILTGLVVSAVAGPYAPRVPVLLVVFAAVVLSAWGGRFLAARTRAGSGRPISGNSPSSR